MVSGRLRNLRHLFVIMAMIMGSVALQAQGKVIRGTIHDQHSDEPVPFASVNLEKAQAGVLADSAGTFLLHFENWPADTLDISSVGYEDLKMFIDPARAQNDTLQLHIQLVPGKFNMGVIVRSKVNRGLQMWKRIVAHKPLNDRYRFQNFSYELYNKLELDLKNVNKEKLAQNRLLKPFAFVFDNVDTADGETFLPAYLTEALSDYYYQKNPLRRREVFRAVKTLGIKNESVARLLGGMDQVVNFYNNFIPVFDKQFISPISDNGDAYYKYKVADTQYVAGRRLIHFLFVPRRKGENTFEGDCWVHDSTFAIQKMSLRLGKEANINYVNQLSLIQEYSLINDSTWFLLKDKFVVDITPLGAKAISFIGRKTTTYHNVVVNSASVVAELDKNKKLEETVLPDTAIKQEETYWSAARPEQLSKSEASIYKMIDTLMRSPSYQKYSNTIYFLTAGYKYVGNYTIGPWYNWVSRDSLEGWRLRFDLETNSDFSKKINLHGYAAYGFRDQKFKYRLDGTYVFQHTPRTQLQVFYTYDIDFGQNYYDALSSDNIFATAIRKAGVPLKYLLVNEKRAELLHEWRSGFSARVIASHRAFEPLKNLPPRSLFTDGLKQNVLATTEFSLRLRYAFLETFLENTFTRISLGSTYPIADFKITRGVSGITNSGYNYTKLSLSISDYMKISPFGDVYYNVFAGKTYGTLPYMLLDVAPGNEIYYYNKYAFNLMNRFEYIHDRFAGFNFEHNFGLGVFKFVPITRKLKFRQFWTAKALWGGLSDANRALNFRGEYPFKTLDGRTYLEVGTGVDNIFKFFRLDFIWRPLPGISTASRTETFGLFGSFHVAF